MSREAEEMKPWRTRDRCYRMGAMAGVRKVSIACAIAMGVMAARGPAAHAQALAAPPVFPVQISATQPGAMIVLRGPTGDITCGEHCALELPQARYKLVVEDANKVLSTQRLVVEMPTRATVTPPDPGMRTIGITIMVVGVVGVAVGGVLLGAILGKKFVEMLGQDCSGPCTYEDVSTSRWLVAGGSLAAGLALGATGFIVLQKSRHAVVDTRPLDASSPAGAPPAPVNDAQLRVRPAAGLRWAGLALDGRF